MAYGVFLHGAGIEDDNLFSRGRSGIWGRKPFESTMQAAVWGKLPSPHCACPRSSLGGSAIRRLLHTDTGCTHTASRIINRPPPRARDAAGGRRRIGTCGGKALACVERAAMSTPAGRLHRDHARPFGSAEPSQSSPARQTLSTYRSSRCRRRSGYRITSGSAQSNCSASSSPMVFFPSMRYGSFSVDMSEPGRSAGPCLLEQSARSR